MENMYIWLFLIAGGTVALLGVLLLSSERELRKKRREVQKLLRDQSDGAIHLSGDGQEPKLQSPGENQELLQKISILSSRLEESQKAVDELQAEQCRLASADSEKQQLEQTIVDLRAQLQMSETRLSESAAELQEIAARNSQVQTELDELARQHQMSEAAMAELRAGQERMSLDAQSEKQQLCAEKQQLQQEIADLRDQLQSYETRLGASAGQCAELTERCSQLQCEVAELKQELDHALTEKDTLSGNLSAAQRIMEDLRTTQEGTQRENQHLHAENEELRRHLGKLNLELQTSESRLGAAAREALDSADRNAKLQEEAAELKGQLQSTQNTIEELRAEQERLAGIHSENQKLRQESSDLRELLQTNESRLNDLTRQNQEAADHYARLKDEAGDLTRQLEEMQPKIRKLEAVRQELAGAESRENVLRSRHDDQETQIEALRRELSDAEGRVHELDAARREMERLYQDLRAENHRLEQEISHGRERSDRSEENQRLADAQQQPVDDSEMKHTLPLDANHQVSPSHDDLTHILQHTTDAGGEVAVKWIASAADPIERVRSVMPLSPVNSSTDRSGETHDNQTSACPDDVEAGTAVNDRSMAAAGIRTLRRKKSRVAKISAVAALAIAVGGTVGLLGARYFASEDAPVTREFASAESSLPIAAASQEPETKPALRLRGKFQIIRATEVYSGPTDKSALITRIEPGMKINVVDSRDGWLEIRSKYGRPPGFVREEAAMKIEQN